MSVLPLRSLIARATLLAAAWLIAPSLALAQTGTASYWDQTGTAVWGISSDWSPSPTGSGGTGVIPTSTYDAYFNGSNYYGTTVVQLSAAQAADGLYFTNSGSTLLESSGTSETLSIGADGITVETGAGAVTLGNATDLMPISITASQTWTNNTTNALAVVSAISDSVASTLTIAGAGNTTFSGVISNGTGALGLTKTGSGTLTISADDSYTGNILISGGTLTTGTGVSGTTSALGALGSANASRTITVGTGATMSWTTNNVITGGGNSAANLPTIVLNGGTLTMTRYNAIGNLQLNSGGTLTGTITDPGSYDGLNLIGTVTVGGTSGSTINNSGNDYMLGGGTLTFNVASTGGVSGIDLAISSPLANGSGDYGGTANFIKTGLGVMQLSGANTYTGLATVNAGTLSITGSLSSSSTLAVGGGTFRYGPASGTQTLGGLTVNAGGSIINAAGGDALALGALTARNTGGTVDFNSATTGTITTTAGNTNGLYGNGGGWATIGAGATLQYAVASATAISGLTYSGTSTVLPAGLTVNSDGSTLPNYTMSNTGGTLSAAISANTLQFTGTSAPTIVATTTNTLTLNGLMNDNTATATISGGDLIAGTAASELIFTGPGNFNVSSVVENNGTNVSALTMAGSGTLTLSGTNLYTGQTYVNGGTLSIGAAANLGAPATAVVNLNGGTLAATGLFSLTSTGTGTPNFGIVLGGNGGAIDVANGDTLTVSGVISGSGAFTKTDSGTLTLIASTDTYSGGTTLNGGTVILGNSSTVGDENAAAFGTSGTTLTINSGATLQPEPGSTGNAYDFAYNFVVNGGTIIGQDGFQRLASNGGSNTLYTFAVGSLGATLEATWNGKDVYVDGVISGSGPITISHGPTGGGSTAVDFTNPANTYSGTVTLSNAGAGITLNIDSAMALQFATVAPGAGTVLLNNSTGATIAGLSGTTGTVEPITTAGTYTLTLGGSGSNSYGGTLVNNTGVLALNMAGSGTQILTGSNTYTGSTRISAGTLQIGSGGSITNPLSTSSTIVDNGTLRFDLSNNVVQGTAFSGSPITGSGGLIQAGAGTITLNAADAFTGPTAINTGIINYQNGTAFGSSPITVASGATAQAQGGITGGASALSLTGTGASGATGALENVSGTNSYAGLISLGGNTTISSDSGTLNLTNTGTIAGSGDNLLLTGAGNGSLAGIIGTGAGTLTKTGNGSWTTSGVDTFSGATNVNAGTLVVAGGLPNTSGITVASSATLNAQGTSTLGGTLAATSATLDLRGAADNTVNTLSIGGGLNLTSSTLYMDFGNAGADSIAVTGAASISGTNTINLSVIAGQTLVPSTYTLISATGGLGSGFTLGTKPAGFYNYSLATSSSTAEVLTITGNTTPVGPTYWTGLGSAAQSDSSVNNWGDGSSFNTSNWSTTSDGLTDPLQVPGATSDVIFTASNATPNSGGTLTTTLDANYQLHSLTFNVPVISPTQITSTVINTNGNSLTLLPTGLTLASTSNSNATINGTGSVVMNGSQSWANNSNSQSLTVSSGISAFSGATALTLNGTGTGGVTLGGVIGNGGGTVSLVFNQAGVTQLNGNNTFTGGVTINSGTVRVGNAGAFNSTTPNAVAFGSGSTGILSLNGTSAIAGDLTTNATVVSPIIQNGSSSAGVATLTVSTTNSDTFAGVMQDGGTGQFGLTASGTGTLTLTGANTYTGPTSVTGGTLQIGGGGTAGSISTSSAIQITGSGGFPATDGLSINLSNAPTITNSIAFAGSGDGFINVPGGESATLTGAITSTGAQPEKTGAGTLTINNPSGNSYTQGTAIGGGDLVITTLSQLGTGGLFMNPGTGGSASLEYTGASGSAPAAWGGSLIQGSGATDTIQVDSAGTNLTIGSAITSSNGAANLVKAGAGTLTLSGANTYTGTTTINAGTLSINTDASLGATATGATLTINNGATLQSTGTFSLGTANRAIVLGTGGGNFDVTGSNNLTVPGVISGTGSSSSLTLVDTGTVTLTNFNTYTGGTTVNNGTLAIDEGNTGVGCINGTLTIGASGTVAVLFHDAFGFNSAAVALTTLNIDGGSLILEAGAANETATGLTVNMTGGTISTTNGEYFQFFVNGYGNTTINTLASSATATISSGMQFRENTPIITVASGTTTSGIDLLVSGAILADAAGTGAFTKNGPGTMEFSGANAFTRATQINAGIINYQNGTAFGTNSAITVASGATAQVAGNITGGALLLTLSGSGASNATGALENVSGTNSYAGLIMLGANSTISSDAGTLNLTNSGTIYGSSTGFALTLAGAGSGNLSSIFNGGISTAAGNGGLIKSGISAWALGGASTYTGITTINGGILTTGAAGFLANGGTASSIGASTNAAGNLVFGGGTLQFAGTAGPVSTDRLFTIGDANGDIAAIDSSSSTSTDTLTFSNIGSIAFGDTNAHTLTLTGSNTGANTFDPVLTDNTGLTTLVKSGAGTWILNSNETYTGGTNVQQGTLILATTTNTLSSAGSVTVGSGTNSGDLQLGTSVATTNQTVTGLATSGSGSANAVVGGNSAVSTLTFNGSGSTTFSGTLGGSGTNNNNLALTVSSGTLILAGGVNTYVGNTVISGSGTLRLGASSGSGATIANSPTISLTSSTATLDAGNLSGGGITLGSAGAQTLGGVGTVLGATTVSTGSTLSPTLLANSTAGSIVPLQFGTSGNPGSLTLGNNSNLSFMLGTPGATSPSQGLASLIAVNGNLNFSGSVNFTAINNNGFNGNGTLGSGEYELISFTGTSNFTPSTFVTGNTGLTTYTFNETSSINGQIDLTITTTSLTWTGLAGNTVGGGTQASWDISSTANWANGSTTGQQYPDGAIVTFGDSQYSDGPAVANSNILIAAGGVMPASVTFTNNAVPYTFADADGTNGINGSTGVTVNGGGSVTFNGPNGYSGGTTVSNGSVLIVSNDNQLGADPASATPGNIVLGGGTANNGTLRVTGSGTINANRGIALGPTSGSGSGTLDAASGATLIYGGVVANNGGTGNLVVASTGGGGTVVLTGANTYGGSTTINSGAALQIGSATATNALPSTSSVTDNGNLSFDLGSSSAVIGNAIGGSGSLTLAAGNTATVELTAANSYGSTTINGGTLQIGAGSSTGTLGAGNVTDNATLAFNYNSGLMVANAISGSGAVQQIGTGATTLGGSNSYNGPTTISAGTLIVSADNNLGADPLGATPGNVIINGTSAVPAVLEANGTFTLNANRGVAVGDTSDSAGIGTFDVTGSNTLTVAGSIANNGAGTGNLVLTDTGTLQLTGANTYGGSTRINNGTLRVSADNNLGADPGSATPGSIVINGTSAAPSTLQANGTFTLNANRGVALGATSGSAGIGTINVNGGSALTVAGIIANNGGTGNLSVAGSGTLILTGTNTYTGSTTINSGATLQIGNGTADGNISTSSGIADNGALVYNLVGSQSYANVISGSGTLAMAAGGTLTLSNFNTFTGGTTVNGGTLALDAGGTGVGCINGTLTINAGGTVTILTHDVFGYSSAAVALTTLNIIGGSLVMEDGVINETATGLTVNMTGGTISSTNGEYFQFFSNGYGNTTINTLANSTTATISAGMQFRENTPVITVASGTTPSGIDLLISGAILGDAAGAGAFTKDGLGTLELSGANTFTRATQINAGIINYQNGTAFGTNSAITVASGATAQVQGGISGGGQVLTLAGTGASNATGALENISGTNSYAGLLALTGNTTISVDTGTLNLTATGTIAGSGDNLTLTGAGNGSIAAIIGTGTGTLTQAGTGAWTLSGINTYTGVTTINSGGTLQIGSGSTDGNIADSGGVTDNGALIYDLVGTQTYGNAISGTGTLTMSGTGTLTLTANSSYTGVTAINGGTLRLSGAASAAGELGGTPTITVNNGGTLLLNSQDVIGYTAGQEALVINYGGTVTNAATSRQTIANNITLTGGTLSSASGDGDGYGNYSLFNGAGIVATSDPTTGTPAVIDANSIGFEDNGNVTFNVTRGAMAPTSDLIVSAALTNFTVYTAGLTKTGNGIMTLSGQSTYSLGTTIDAGTILIGASNSGTSGPLGLSTSTVTLGASSGSSPASLLTGGAFTFTNPITVAAGGSGTLTVGGNSANASVLSGSTITLDNNLSVSQVTGGALSITDALVSGAAGTQTLSFTGAGAVSVGGPIGGGTGTIAVVQSGTGTTTLAGANSYAGGTSIQNGTLRAGATNALPTTGTVTFGAASTAGTLDLNGYGVTIGGLTVAAGATPASQIITNSNTSLAGSTAALNYSGGTNSFGGTLQDGGGGNLLALTVSAGTLTLTGANTYSGGTNVNGGTLRLTSTTGSGTGVGPVAIGSGAMLAGGGGASLISLSGSVNIASGGTIAPSGGGAALAGSTGSLTVGALTLNNGTSASQLNYQFVNSSQLDSIAVTNALTLPSVAAANEVEFNFFSPSSTNPLVLPVGGPYALMTFGSLTNTFNPATLSVNPADLSGTQAEFTESGNVIDLTIITANGSASWASNGSPTLGNSANWFDNSANWMGHTVPSGAGLTATFDDGLRTASSVSVAVGTNTGSDTVGGLVFSSTTTEYTLNGGTLILNNNGSGPNITVSTPSALYPVINTPLVLADGNGTTTTFTVSGGSYLDVFGTISEATYTGQKILLTGGGTLQLDNAANSYTGGTTVSGATLLLDPASGPATPLGSGPLAINGPSSIVNVSPTNTGVTVTVGGLSASDGGTLNVAPSTTLTVNQTGIGVFAGTLSLSAASSGGGLTVGSGTVQLNVASATTLGTGVTATVASGATLQLTGTVSALSDPSSGNLANVLTQGTGSASDGKLSVIGATTQTVGVISGQTVSSSPTTYSGNTTVGDGTNAANLTATQILQNTLTINAGSTVTIAPSGSGIPGDEVAAASATVSGVALAAGSSDSDSDSSSDPFTAIEAAISSGSISSAKGQQLENRIAAIERLAATDPGLDVSLLEDRVLAALPPSSVWSSSGTSPLVESGSGLLAVDSGAFASSSATTLGGAAAFAPSADFGGSPAAVPEPSTLLLAVFGGVGVMIAIRRRTIYRD